MVGNPYKYNEQIISYEAKKLENMVNFCVPTWSIFAGPVTYVTGPAKTSHIYTIYTCSENDTFLGHCLR